MIVYLGKYAYYFTHNPKVEGRLLIHGTVRRGYGRSLSPLTGFREPTAGEYNAAVSQGIVERLRVSAGREGS